MSLRSLFRAWEEFFFAKQSPVPIALFRIIYGLLVAITLGLLRTDWLNWYGVRAWVSLQTALKLEPGNRLNLFAIIPQRDDWINGLFWVALGSTILLAIGFLTRVNSISLSLPHLNPAKELVHYPRRRYVSATGGILLDFRSGGSSAVPRSPHSSPSWQGIAVHSTAKPLGSTYDSASTVFALSRNVLTKNQGCSLVAGHCAFLCVSHRRTQTVSAARLVFQSYRPQARQLVGFGTGVFSRRPHLGEGISIRSARTWTDVSPMARILP